MCYMRFVHKVLVILKEIVYVMTLPTEKMINVLVCKDNFYPKDGDNKCTIQCLDNITCNSNGSCNNNGTCDCYEDETNGFYTGDDCNTCLTNYYRKC